MLFVYVAAIIALLLIMLFTSRTRVSQQYKKFTKINNSKGINGAQVANYIIQKEGLNLELAQNKEDLCDAYYYKEKTLLMSSKVCNNPSIASVAIVCHELGHATQDKEQTTLWKVNHFLRAVTRFTNKLIVPLLVFGLISYATRWPQEGFGTYMVITAAVLFIAHALAKLTIIPLEFDASKRAVKLIKKYDLLTAKELRKSRGLLNTAGQTYIVALFDEVTIFTRKLFRKIFH